ncbi:MAG: hypothetical protein ACLP9L_14130 [Thermoguttaceae bacterium]
MPSRCGILAGVTVIWIASFFLAFSGCSSQTQSREREQSNLKPLAIFYGQFIGRHSGQSPANEAEFKSYLQTIPVTKLASFGVTNVDSIFTSSRDQKPYVVVYGCQSSTAAEAPDQVIAYEQVGRGGKRFVAFLVGKIDEVDDARFKQLVPDTP